MKYILVLFLFITLISCENSKDTKVSVELGENKEFVNLPSCHCDSLILNETEKLVLLETIFTGTCFLNYPQADQKYIEKQILDGLIHGKISYFDKTGELLFEEVYNKGKLLTNAENKSRCNCMDLIMKDGENNFKKNYLNESLFTGTCEDFFPNTNQLYLESNYKNGLLHGFTVYYQKDGSVLMMQNYKDGVLIEDIIPQ
tara:strand:+ start:250 stop:849 length:600 start_codon:yes stop_codon:yes gene_type:complete